ncbi:radical SAM family protein [Ruminiclostridium sufflavum DSM 19573]|uniref:Radical SAM family protein n=2 Tax=Ruminiclostridium TaxID=1508657 RepID=A0A318XM97_9FIRM|nr:radical SAM family protein [Ruminiclostridium sufflavum DSM 19573]
MRLSTRPDYISEEILDLLLRYDVRTIELGAQSLDDKVLLCSHRGHTIEDVAQAAKMIKDRGISLGIQTMIGLPEDTKEKDIMTARKVVALSPDIVRIYPALVIKDTYLQKMYSEGRYRPVTVDEAVDICAELLEIYEASNINVIRIGLQPTESISENGDVVAGPFHPAFRQLVQSRLILNKMIEYIKDNSLDNASSIEIECNEREMSNVIGQKKTNIILLKNKFDYKNISIKINNDTKYFKILKQKSI